MGASGVRVGGRRESELDAKCLDCVRGSRKGQRPGGKSSRDKEREDRRAALTNTGVKHLEMGSRASVLLYQRAWKKSTEDVRHEQSGRRK